MKKLILIICVFCSIQFQNDHNGIVWSAKNKLRWENFKGNPEKKGSHTAITATHIDLEFEINKDTLFVYIYSIMNPDASWVMRLDKNQHPSVNLLKHEQAHFDICEIFARKLRRSIIGVKIKEENVNTELTKLDELNDSAMHWYQVIYDRETGHSSILTKQKEWEKKVIKELEELEAYSEPELRIALMK